MKNRRKKAKLISVSGISGISVAKIKRKSAAKISQQAMIIGASVVAKYGGGGGVINDKAASAASAKIINRKRIRQ